MSWVATAIAGSAVLGYIGSKKQAEAAESAGETQASAAQQQLAFQREMFERLQQQQAPYRQAGYTALNQINALLGLPPAYVTQEQMFQVMPTQRAQVGPTGMPLPMVDQRPRQYLGATNPRPTKPGVPAQFTSSGLQARNLPAGRPLPMADQRPRGMLTPEQAAQYGAQTSGRRGRGGGALFVDGGKFTNGVNPYYERPDAIQQPAIQIPGGDGGGYPLQGPTVAPGYQVGEGMMGFGAFARPFTAQDLTTHLAPNYEFMLQQGLGAANQMANVGGGGSNVQRGAIKFAQDYARNAYQDALNNYRLQQGDIFNRLSNISGTGQTAQQNLAQTAGQFGSNISQLGIGAAQAQAAGQIGAANAMAGGLGNIGGTLSTYGLLRGMGAFGQPGAAGGATQSPGFYTNPSPVGQTAGTNVFTSPTGGFVGDVNVPKFGVA